MKAAITFTFICIIFVCCSQKDKNDFSTWKFYRGDEGSNAYSSLAQINTSNVKNLKVAWTYRTGDKSDVFNLECNPIVINNILYGVSPKLKTFAIDAATGKQLWIFDPFNDNSATDGGVARGLTYWEGKNDKRIFTFVYNKLLALDATTGKQIMSFGDSGYVDLNKDLRNDGKVHVEDVQNTSPAIIFKDLLITGSAVSEGYDGSPGHIRAYDVRTGKRRWIFHTIPQPGEFGYDTWPRDASTSGGCNAWGGLSLDAKRGIVFAATGSPANDFHGGERIGENLFGNSVIALDAATGKRIWHYQVLHHDLWDLDLPTAPNLVTIKKDGKSIDAVAQVSKQGFIYMFDRETGKPIFPIEERPVPASSVPGEQSWPTQPIPVKPLPLCRQSFDEAMITDISPEAHEFALNRARQLEWGNIYQPTSLKGIVMMPGIRGGAEWSGACVDMETGIMYVGINDIPNIVELEEKKDDRERLSGMPVIKAGEILYKRNCAVCHGDEKQGTSNFPPLLNIEQRLKPDDVNKKLQRAQGMMPSFNSMPTEDKEAIIAFLFGLKSKRNYTIRTKDTTAASRKRRYGLKDYIHLEDQDGYPGVKPPWGTLNAVDLNSGDLVWKIPLGEYPELAAKGHRNTGTQLFGGGIVTAGGLVFIGASQDEKFRAFDKKTGKLLWEYQLPFGGYATPSTYEVNGKQFVVIAAGGGGRQQTKAGDQYIAFALP